MIALNDFIIKTVGRKSTRFMKFYRTCCNNCSSDRGYLLKSQDKRPTCNKCAKLGSIVPETVREKMSTSAFTRSPSVKKAVDGRSIRDYSTYVGPPTFLSDMQKKIKHNVRTLVRQKLKNRGLSKNNKTFDALGYSPEDLIKHLESQFHEGISWENYGPVWHIDHMIPDSWFTYSSMQDDGFKQSWTLDNLQPLWADKNHSKGNRYISEVRSHATVDL